MAPAGRLAGVVAGGVRQVVNVVKAYADKADKSDNEATNPASAGA